MLRTHSVPLTGTVVIFIGALIGAAISIFNYLTPMTGITGTPGALLVIISSLLLIFDAIVLAIKPRGFIGGLFLALGFLGVLGTLAAAWFLHAWWLIAAMVIVASGLILHTIFKSTAHTAGAA